eukprot:764411-Hanusia_phi.AAC.2
MDKAFAVLEADDGNREDGWKYDPFLLTHEDKKLFGRVGGKCDIVAWLSVIEVTSDHIACQ